MTGLERRSFLAAVTGEDHSALVTSYYILKDSFLSSDFGWPRVCVPGYGENCGNFPAGAGSFIF